MIIRNSITEVAYNVQTTVDAKNLLTLDYKLTNENDSKAMGPMLGRAKKILGSADFTALYDKAYHTGSELKTGIEMGVKLMVAIPGVASLLLIAGTTSISLFTMMKMTLTPALNKKY
jgi:hypothetical protein